jgi:YidC/Oxa1 family membrane protein insertase
MDIQRGLLFIALAFVLILIYQRWLEDQQPPPTTPPTAQTSAPMPDTGDVPQAPAAVDQPPESPSEPQAVTTSEQVVVTTDLFRAHIDTLGGDLKKVELLKYPVSIDQPDNPFQLLRQQGADVFISQTGLIGRDREFPNHKTSFSAESTSFELAPDKDSLEAKLFWTSPDGVKYAKVYTFHRDSYNISIDYLVDNQTKDNWSGYFYAQFLRTHIVPERSFFLGVVPSYLGGAIYTPEEKYEKIDFADMTEQDLNRDVNSGWVAMLQHYFVGAWLPQPEGPYQFYSGVINTAGGPRYNIGYKTVTPTVVKPGESGRLSTKLFVGPKEQKRLKQQGEGFVLSVDYGWLTPLSAPLFWILERINAVVNNWGWAIIILTLLIKLAFYPLSAASYKSMAKMKKLQPRLQTLKERYGDDKQKLQQAMMELYKKDKINPLGGCLPIVIQIPVFIALYWVLLESVELRQAEWAFWIKDLSVKDPYFVLPILMGASMVGQQLLNPSPLDPMQKKIMMALPVVFTLLFLYFPAGLVLYWLVNNVLSIAQQWHINRTIGVKST